MRLNVDKLVQWSTAVAVVLLAIIAGWVSYIHAHDVVIRYGQTGILGFVYPATTDGLIYIGSMVILNAARKAIKAPGLAWATVITGVLITAAANIYDGLSHGPIGAFISGWPAVALVLGYELCMMLIRSAGKAESGKPDVKLSLKTDATGWHEGMEKLRESLIDWPKPAPENLATSQGFEWGRVREMPSVLPDEPDETLPSEPAPEQDFRQPISLIPDSAQRIPVRFGGLGDQVGGAVNGAGKRD